MEQFVAYRCLNWKLLKFYKLFWKERQSENFEMKIGSSTIRYHFILKYDVNSNNIKLMIKRTSLFSIKEIQVDCIVKVKNIEDKILFSQSYQLSARDDFEAVLFDSARIAHFSQRDRIDLEIEMKLTAFASQLCPVELANRPHTEISRQHQNDSNDFIFICADQIEVPVNKFTLSEASPVFKAMFNAEMVERKEDCAHITDITSVTMNQAIKFIKNPGSSLTFPSVDDTKKLMYMAEKYDPFDLKIKCHDSLVDRIGTENVFDILEAANFYNMQPLEAKCLLTIVRDYHKLKKNEDSWSKFKALPISLMTKVTDALFNFSAVEMLNDKQC